LAWFFDPSCLHLTRCRVRSTVSHTDANSWQSIGLSSQSELFTVWSAAAVSWSKRPYIKTMTCRGCRVSLFDFAAITANDDKLRDFLVAHHVIAGSRFCDTCHEECRVDWRRKLFRCDRQVSVKLHGGRTKVTRKHYS